MRKVILVLLFAMTAYAAPDWGSVDYGDTSSAQSEGKGIADTAKGYNSSGNMKERLQSPVMGGGEMSTLGKSYQSSISLLRG